MSIAVVGSINIDIAAYAHRLPRPGETLHGKSYQIGLGGKGANQAVAVAKLGADLDFIGRVGTDSFGETALKALAQYGVATGGVLVDSVAASGIALIGIDDSGQNAITVIAGANAALDHTDCQRAGPALDRAAVLLLQLEIPTAVNIEAAARVRAHGGLVILDPAPVPDGGIADDVLRSAAVITPNEVEAGALTGTVPRTPDDGIAAASALRNRGVEAVIVKMGAMGAVLAHGNLQTHVPPLKVHAIDTVAAGDCFNGALAVALAEGRSLLEAVRFASAAGALATTRRGAAAAAPTRAEVERLLAGT